MTSFRLSELPTPYRSAGASPLGTHEGTVTPPEPPVPPTPTGKVYFSGTNTSVEPTSGGYRYIFDNEAFENIGDFIAKAQDDTLSITVNGVTNELKIDEKIVETEDDITYTDFEIGFGTGADTGVGFETDGGVSTCYNVSYIIYTQGEPLDSVALVIADPS